MLCFVLFQISSKKKDKCFTLSLPPLQSVSLTFSLTFVMAGVAVVRIRMNQSVRHFISQIQQVSCISFSLLDKSEINLFFISFPDVTGRMISYTTDKAGDKMSRYPHDSQPAATEGCTAKRTENHKIFFRNSNSLFLSFF